MSLYGIFETNKDAEKDGFELCIQDGDDEITFIIARAGGANKRFAARFDVLTRPHQHSISKGIMSDVKSAEIMAQAMAETIILDWKNVVDREGNPMPYSVESAKQLLIELPDLRVMIMEESTRTANFLQVDREVALGN